MRHACNADASQIKDIIHSTLKTFNLPIEEDGIDRDLGDPEGLYLRQGGHFWVVEEDRTDTAGSAAPAIIGTCALTPGSSPGQVELRKMYLLPRVRGIGLGRSLLLFALSVARNSKYTSVFLDTASPLHAAIQLYQSVGFKRVPAHHCVSARCDLAYELSFEDMDQTNVCASTS